MEKGEHMEKFITLSNDKSFFLDYCVKHLREYDNAEALNRCLSFLYIEKGSGIAMVNDKIVPFLSPCVFCINEREHVVIDKSCKCEIYALYFLPSIINNELNFQNVRKLPQESSFTIQQDCYMMHYFFEREEKKKGIFMIGPSTEKRIRFLFDTLEKEITEQKTNWPCRSRSYIMELLFLLDSLTESTGEEESLADVADESFLQILQYLYMNYDKKITLDHLSEQFHISKSTIANKFKENLGESFLEYLNKLRIRMAATILRDTKLPVNEIMYRVGFQDTVHFMRTFKKYMNESPSSYRKKYCWL